MSNKQSSVEWLISQLKISTYWNSLISELELMECGEIDILKQAKAMHEVQVRRAFYDGQRYEGTKTSMDYYNETFGSQTTLAQEEQQ